MSPPVLYHVADNKTSAGDSAAWPRAEMFLMTIREDEIVKYFHNLSSSQ